MYLAHRIGDAWLHLALPSPVNNVHSHRFKLLFVLQLFFCFRFALDTKHAAFAPLCCTCTCEESNSMDTSVRERDYVCWSHQSIHFLMPQQSSRMKSHVQLYFIIINDPFLVTLGFLVFICWLFLRCFFNGFWLMKSKKQAYVCTMKLRYNYLVNLLL